jgi:hypothetical protein
MPATYTSYVELKLKLSDLEVVLTNACTELLVTGYIQSAPTYKIDSGNLSHWFEANWSPVDGQLVRNYNYRQWSQMDPCTSVWQACRRHTRSRQESGVCSPPNLEGYTYGGSSNFLLRSASSLITGGDVAAVSSDDVDVRSAKAYRPVISGPALF